MGAHEALETGLFYTASKFRIIDGSPKQREWLQIFETDRQDPLTACARLVEALSLPEAADGRQRYSGSFKLVSSTRPVRDGCSPSSARSARPSSELLTAGFKAELDLLQDDRQRGATSAG
jgi:hypothetical protein